MMQDCRHGQARTGTVGSGSEDFEHNAFATSDCIDEFDNFEKLDINPAHCTTSDSMASLPRRCSQRMGGPSLLRQQSFRHALLIAAAFAIVFVGTPQFAAGFSTYDPQPTPYPSKSNCPCITLDDRLHVSSMSVGNSSSDEGNSSMTAPAAADPACQAVKVVPGVCFPPKYGYGFCAAWDRSLYSPCVDQRDFIVGDGLPVLDDANNDLPEWCNQGWCYVDPDNCGRPHERSIYFPERYFSYATCGYVDDNSSRLVRQSLARKAVRVSYPSDEGWGLVTEADGTKAGFSVDIYEDIAQRWGMETEVVPLDNVSLTQYGSPYTACCHSLAMNSTDVCVGAVRSRANQHIVSAACSLPNFLCM